MARVTGLRSIELRVPDLEAAVAFYEESWGLTAVARTADVCYLRGTGAEHHVVVLRRGAERGLVQINLATDTREAVDGLYAAVLNAGHGKPPAPVALDEPGGGYGFAFVDAEGRSFGIFADVARHADVAPGTDRPVKLSHVVLNSSATDAVTAMFTDVLGFRLRDRTKMMNFLGCCSDHHSIALARFGGNGINHVAFDVPSFDALMRGAGRLKKQGYPIQWGVGRHGPGNNIFAYFIDPDDVPVEYTAEMQQIDDAIYVPGTPEDWGKRGPNLDAWGLADPPTDRFHHVSTTQLAHTT